MVETVGVNTVPQLCIKNRLDI